MDHPKDIESTLNALLLNASALQEAGGDQISSAALSDVQQRLIDNLFSQWNGLSEDEKKEVLALDVETKIFELAKKNQACLREVGCRLAHKKTSSLSEQLELNL